MILLIYYLFKWIESPSTSNDQNHLEQKIEEVIQKKKKKDIHTTVEACKNGIIKGCLITLATTGGNIPAAMTAGLASGVVSSIVHHIE
jgi:hypothetical protein